MMHGVYNVKSKTLLIYNMFHDKYILKVDGRQTFKTFEYSTYISYIIHAL